MKLKRKAFLVTLALAMTLMLTAQAALADYVSFTGTVASSEQTAVLAPIGGTVDAVDVIAGQRVEAGDVLATFETTKVYASQDGTVTGIFAQAGDSADVISQTYGAVLYVEPSYNYTIAASTDYAYDSEDNVFVHVGESVYLKGYSDSSHTGTGTITAVSGTDFTVRVDSGEFLVGESVTVFRSEKYTSKSRIGRGDLSRTNPTSYTGSGSVVSIAVTDGQEVKKGDLLFETLDGTFDAYYMTGLDITSPVSGTVAEVKASADSTLNKGETAFVIYPDSAVWIEASVDETDLGSIAVGDKVSIEFTWNDDDDIVYDGTIAMISAIGTTNGDSVSYPVYISFTPDETVKYGMSVVISSPDEDATDGTDAAADATAEPTAEAATDAQPDQNAAPADGAQPAGTPAPTEGN